MRLTKQMKANLINIVLNKTKDPKSKADEFGKKLQELLYTAEPVFKQFIDTYGYHYKFREGIKHKKFKHLFDVVCPDDVLKKYLGVTGYYCELPEDIEKIHEDFRPFFLELQDWFVEMQEYNDLKDALKGTIESCTTDTQLREMYPDFVKYFNTAGITTKSIKQLPAKSNLPDGLVKFGLVLTTVEDIEEEIKEEMKEENQ